MRFRNLAPIIAISIAALFSATGASAQQRNSTQELIDGIIRDVITRTVDAAQKEVRRNTGVDILERGYDRSKRYRPAPRHASRDTRRELRKLNEKHDRKIEKLERELRRKLKKAEDEFQTEAANEDKAEKIRKKRKKLRKKVDKAYAEFEKKIRKENDRFDEKRRDILSKS